MKFIRVQPGFDDNEYGQLFSVANDGRIKVYDEIAGYFTSHHGLTPEQEQWVRDNVDNVEPITRAIQRPDGAGGKDYWRHIG